MSEREPCPWRIVDDAGGAFALGLFGGSIWHTVGGARNAPKGQMFNQAVARFKARAPILGGSFAIWGTFFSVFDCSLAHIRKKEDPWNAIASGFLTGGLLAIRAGPKVAATNAFFGGVVLAAIEGLNIFVARTLMPWYQKRQLESEGAIKIDKLEPPNDPMRVTYTPRWTPGQDAKVNSSEAYAGLGASAGGVFGGVSGAGSGTGSGFDLDSIYKYDTQTNDETWKPKEEINSSDTAEPNAGNKPWWKPW